MEVKQPFPGIYLWQDPTGQTYLVDHTGTRRLPDAPARQTRTWTTTIDLVYAPAV